jgi:hypothetical protein
MMMRQPTIGEFMPTSPNTETNQTPDTINLPDETGVDSAALNGGKPDDEQLPPSEVPGRQEAPEHVPEKAQGKIGSPTLVKN